MFFHRETNRVAHELDDTRATGGVRMLKKMPSSGGCLYIQRFASSMADIRGCNPKRKVTPDMKKSVSDQ